MNPVTVKTYFMETPEAKIHRVEIIFYCKMIDEKQKIILSPEHSDFKFLSLKNLDELELSKYMKSIVNNLINASIST